MKLAKHAGTHHRIIQSVGGDYRMARGNLENQDISGRIFKLISVTMTVSTELFRFWTGQVAG
jgi:hypothetical protein